MTSRSFTVYCDEKENVDPVTGLLSTGIVRPRLNDTRRRPLADITEEVLYGVWFCSCAVQPVFDSFLNIETNDFVDTCIKSIVQKDNRRTRAQAEDEGAPRNQISCKDMLGFEPSRNVSLPINVRKVSVMLRLTEKY